MTQTISKKLIALIIALSVALSSALIASVVVNNKSTANAGNVMMTPKMRVGVHGTTYRSTDWSVGAAYCSLMDHRPGPGNYSTPSAVPYTAPAPTNSIYLEPDYTHSRTINDPNIIKQIGYAIAAFGYDPPAEDPYRGMVIKQAIAGLTGTPWHYAMGGSVADFANMVVKNAQFWGTQDLRMNDVKLNWDGGKDKGKVGQTASLTNIGVTNAQKNAWWDYRTGMSTRIPRVKITLTGDMAINAPGQPKVWEYPLDENYSPSIPIGLIRTGTKGWSYKVEINNIPDNVLLEQYPLGRKHRYQNLLSARLKTISTYDSTIPDIKKDVSLEFSSDISSKVIEPGTPFHDTGHVTAKSNDPAVPATWPQREFNWRDSDGNAQTSKEPVPFRIKFHLWGPSQTPIQEGANPGLNRLPPRRDNTPGVAVFS